MNRDKAHIPVLNLDQEPLQGLHIRNIDELVTRRSFLKTLHRDDYLIFLLHKSGESIIMVDFKDSYLSGTCASIILPGCIHQMVSSYKPSGWLLAVDVELIDERYRNIFSGFNPGRVLPVITELARQLDNLSCSIQQLQKYPCRLQRSIAMHLVSAFAGLLAAQISTASGENTGSRQSVISSDFAKLLRDSFRQQKSPSWYAAKMNLSASYLNECIKATTGWPVSVCIQKEIILESKRMLAHSNKSIKEIASQLGYDDPSYFNRLFFNATGQRPTAFRAIYRE